MLSKIREISQNRNDIDKLEASVTSQEILLKEMVSGIQDAKKELHEARIENQKLKADYDHVIVLSKKHLEEIRSEVSEFRLWRSQLENRLKADIEKQMRIVTSEITNKVHSVKDAQSRIKDTLSEMEALRAEIVRLKDIASKIRADDFQMSKNIAIIEKANKEKQNLLSRVHHLERIIASERRKYARH